MAYQLSEGRGTTGPGAGRRREKRHEDPEVIARANWARYRYVAQRGHDEYCKRARRNQNFYLGGGLQWSEADRAAYEEDLGVKVVEMNEIFDAVNTAAGYQINNRMGITFRPRNSEASQETAEILSKVANQICDNTKYPWKETNLFLAGLVTSRSYFDVRVNFDDSLTGEFDIDVLDDMDVIPDPDAKDYDTKKWADVTVSRWLTLDEIEGLYGPRARAQVEEQVGLYERGIDGTADFGDGDESGVQRLKFGDDETGYFDYDTDMGRERVLRVRIVDRQYWKTVPTLMVVFPSGDTRVADSFMSAKKMEQLRARGCIFLNRPKKRVRWTVSTCNVLLHDDWSPYTRFTIIPYFPFFLQGQTRGMVDNAISPQEMLNKALTKELQAVSQMANSGLMAEEESITNVHEDDLGTEMGRAAPVLIIKKDAKKWPEKIKPNQVPAGLSEFGAKASLKIQKITGNTDVLRGDSGKNQSGKGAQAQQFAAQMPMTLPLDNLSRARNLVAEFMVEIVQKFYDEPRIFNVTKKNMTNAKLQTESLQLNWPDDAGNVINNLTVGEYDVVISQQPAQVTWENSQYNQAMEMRRDGINLPDEVVIEYSTLGEKAEILEQMRNAASNPEAQAKAHLMQMQAALAETKAVESRVQAFFAAIRTGQIISAVPQVAGIADAIARSAGAQDMDGGTYAPSEAEIASMGPPAPPPPVNTNPTTSGNAARGANAGIESGQAVMEA